MIRFSYISLLAALIGMLVSCATQPPAYPIPPDPDHKLPDPIGDDSTGDNGEDQSDEDNSEEDNTGGDNDNGGDEVDPRTGLPADTKFLRGHPVAKPVPGRAGWVFNPWTLNMVKVEGIPSETLVRDPDDANVKHKFRVP